MTWSLNMSGHHDDAAHNGPASPSLKAALQHFVEELRGQGHSVNPPAVNGVTVPLDSSKEGQSTP